MVGFTDILNSILVLGLAMLVGFICVKSGYIKPEVRDALSKLLVKVTLPILVVTTMTKLGLDRERIVNCITILVIGWACIPAMYLLGAGAAKLFRMQGERAVMHSCMSCFGNIVFVAYPLIQKIYGDEGILYAALFAFANDCYLWTFGVFKLSGVHSANGGSVRSNIKRIINPGTAAVAVSLVMMAFGLKFGGIFKEAFEGIGSVTTYLSMLFLGGTLAMVDFKHIYRRVSLFVLLAVKMLLFPAMLLIVLRLIGVNETVTGVAVLQVAMPVSTVLSILAAEYKCDVLYGAEGAFITTALCIVTLPAVYYMIVNCPV